MEYKGGDQDILDTLLRKTVWCSNYKESSILYSAVRISRNFIGFNYPDKMKKSEFQQVEDIVDNSLLNLKDREYVKIDLQYIDEIALIILKEKKIIPELKHSERSRVKLYIFDDLKTFILTNYNNHLSIVSYSSTKISKESKKEIDKIVDCFDNKIFQFDENFGYLSNSILFLGTGLKTYSAYILPYQREINRLRSSISGFESNGFVSVRANQFGSDNEDIIITTNRDSFSFTPQQILNNHIMLDKELLKIEKDCKEKILNEKSRIDIIADQTLKMMERDSLSYKSFMEILFKLMILKDYGYKYLEVPKLKSYYYQFTRGGISYKEGVKLSTLDCDKLRVSMLKSLLGR
ncbi:MAG: hypothetical protein CR982_05140 [Candidatus Cloacimonadota bacterium]|nr:MAG: hypothetical protein CR982_05140 [Candidatus Cloacimonadota bacterium]PIE78804.1 MAG: hypothetical protein CSA15_06025 [Candidatus Delongbacteria bacterium]